MKDIPKLTVKLGGEPVGVLQSTPDGTRSAFEYSAQWLEHGFSISPMELPLQTGLFLSKEGCFNGNFAVFEDSMPDGYGLYLLDRMLAKEGTSLKELTVLQRLAIIGESGMGALTYEPRIGLYNTRDMAAAEDLELIQEKALAVLSESTVQDVEWLHYNSNNSGGARPKAILKKDDGSEWLVKFRHVYDPVDAGKTEYLYMKTAEECGIKIPRIELLNGKYVATERFDRSNGVRRHVLTATALLQSDFRSQAADYTNLLALTGFLTQDPAQVEQMYRLMCFNVIADNKDDHAKNFSFICDSGNWSLAPAYDLTYSPKGTDGEHATSVFYDGNPDAALLIKAGTGIRIPESRCRAILQEIGSVCARRLGVSFRF